MFLYIRINANHLLLGFLLMCLGTLISLLPAYLTIGLTNDVLVPLQGNIAVPWSAQMNIDILTILLPAT